MVEVRSPGPGADDPTRASASAYRPGRPIGGVPEPTAVLPGGAGTAAGGSGGGGRYADPKIHPRDLGRRGIITPFARLARGQAFSVMGEALFAIGLANTVFFSTD